MPIVTTNSSPAGRIKRVRAVTAGSGTGPGANEPVGFTALSETSMAGTPGAAGAVTNPTTGIITGPAWGMFSNASGDLAQDSSVSGPISPGSAVRFRFANGLTAGSQPGGQTGVPLTNGGAGYTEYYERGAFRVGETDFETQQIGVKALGYWGFGSPVGGPYPNTELYSIIEGAGSGVGTSVMSSWVLWFGQQGALGSRRLDMNVNTGTRINAGQWHKYEMHKVANTIGVANGVFRVWIDGVLCFDYADLVWRTADRPIPFTGKLIDPIWGGGGGTAKTRDDFIWFDHCYISGKA